MQRSIVCNNPLNNEVIKYSTTARRNFNILDFDFKQFEVKIKNLLAWVLSVL